MPQKGVEGNGVVNLLAGDSFYLRYVAMKKLNSLSALGVAILWGMTVSGTAFAQADDWVRFRGPAGAGVVEASPVPTKWSTENIKWSVDLPGPGASCPIVLGDKVFLTCYTGYGMEKDNPGEVSQLKRHLLCVSSQDGSIVWNQAVDSAADEDPYTGFIQEHGYASSTPTTDGKMIYVFFGKTGVLAFDLEGKQQWQTSVGTQSDPAKWGGGSSLMLVDDLLIVNAGNEGRKLLALNKTTGEEVWKIEDETFGNCWSTPIMVETEKRPELVISMPGKILALDPKTGQELWQAASPITSTVCASVVQHNGVVFTMGGRRGMAIAVRCGGDGDVSETHTVWNKAMSSGIGTPVIVDGKMFWSSRGLAFCVNCEDGEMLYEERLPAAKSAESEEGAGARRGPTGDYASPIAIGKEIIVLQRNGRSVVLKAEENFDVVGESAFSDDPGPFNATPALGKDRLFIRSDKKLYCIQ